MHFTSKDPKNIHNNDEWTQKIVLGFFIPLFISLIADELSLSKGLL